MTISPRPYSGEGQGVRASLPSRASQTWAMLIKRVYEIDPLACPQCGGQMKVVAFIEPPQGDVIEKILRHCGLWQPSTPRAPPAGDGSVHGPDERFRGAPGIDLRGHRHVHGHLLRTADARGTETVRAHRGIHPQPMGYEYNRWMHDRLASLLDGSTRGVEGGGGDAGHGRRPLLPPSTPLLPLDSPLSSMV